MHTKRLDTMFSENLLLSAVDIAQTDINDLARANDMFILQPPKDILLLLAREPRQKRHGHTVNIPTGAHLRNVDVGVRIDPDDGDVTTQTLAGGLGRARDGTNRDGVVTAQGEY